MTRKAKCDECGKTVPLKTLSTGVDCSVVGGPTVTVCQKCYPKLVKRSWAAIDRVRLGGSRSREPGMTSAEIDALKERGEGMMRDFRIGQFRDKINRGLW